MTSHLNRYELAQRRSIRLAFSVFGGLVVGSFLIAGLVVGAAIFFDNVC